MTTAISDKQQDDVLVRGRVPLTRGMVGKVANFFRWVLEAQITQEQVQELQQFLVESWQQQAQEDIDGVLAAVQMQDVLEKSKQEEELALLLAQLQANLLAELRKHPGKPPSQWLLDIYNAAHPPIAPGTPPLTLRAADANFEMQAFILHEVMGGESIVTNRAHRDAFVRSLAAQYASMTPSEQQEISWGPLAWASLRRDWPTLPVSVQAAYRAHWHKSRDFAATAPALKAAGTEPPAAAAIETTGDAKPLAAGNSAASKSFKELAQEVLEQHRANMAFSRWIRTGGPFTGY